MTISATATQIRKISAIAKSHCKEVRSTNSMNERGSSLRLPAAGGLGMTGVRFSVGLWHSFSVGQLKSLGTSQKKPAPIGGTSLQSLPCCLRLSASLLARSGHSSTPPWHLLLLQDLPPVTIAFRKSAPALPSVESPYDLNCIQTAVVSP